MIIRLTNTFMAKSPPLTAAGSALGPIPLPRLAQLEKTITATSSLMIDLSEPKVIEYWPNCIEACINTQIAARFNMLMMTSTYRNGVELSQCADENCNSNDIIKNIDVNVGTDDSDWNTIRFYPKGNTLLEPNTWYLVKLNKNIKFIFPWGRLS